MPWKIADIHLFEYPQLATYRNGVNERLLDGLSIIKQVCEWALESGDTTVDILGDINYARDYVSTVVSNLAASLLSHYRREGITFRAIPGNHDFASGGETYCGLHYIRRDVQLITKPTLTSDGVFWIPYTSSRAVFLEACNVAVREGALALHVHQGFHYKGVVSNWAYFIDNIAAPSELPDLPLLAGHYHNQAMIGSPSRQYIGSPYQLNWGDEGHAKGVIQVTYKKGCDPKIVRKQTRYPEHQTLSVETCDDLRQRLFCSGPRHVSVEGGFARLKGPREFDFKEGNRLLRKAGARCVGLHIYRTEEAHTRELIKEVKAASYALDSFGSFKKFLRVYAGHMAKKHNLDTHELYNIAVSVLDEG